MSDVDEFTLGVLKRAKARSEILAKSSDRRNSEHARIDNLINKIEKTPQKTCIKRNESVEDSKLANVSTPNCPNQGEDSCDPRVDKLTKSILKSQSTKRNVSEEKSCVKFLDISAECDSEKENAEDSLEDLETRNDGGEEELKGDKEKEVAKKSEVIEKDVGAQGNTVSPDSKKMSELEEKFEAGEVTAPVHFSLLRKQTRGDSSISSSPNSRKSRLNALAETINAWEDDTSHIATPSSRFNISSKSNSVVGSGSGTKSNFPSKLCSDSPLSLDKPVSSHFSSKHFQDTPKSTKPPEYYFGGGHGYRNRNYSFETSLLSKNPSSEQVANNLNKATKHFNDLSQQSNISPKVPKAHVTVPTNPTNIPFPPKFPYDNDIERTPQDACSLDRSVIMALEAQGFQHVSSEKKLVYNYSDKSSPEKKLKDDSTCSTTEMSDTKRNRNSQSPMKALSSGSPTRNTSLVKKRSASPVREMDRSPIKHSKSSVLLGGDDANTEASGPKIVDSIKKRFENGQPSLAISKPLSNSKLSVPVISANRGNVAQKASIFENSVNVSGKDPSELSVAERAKLFEAGKVFSSSSSSTSTPNVCHSQNTVTGSVYTTITDMKHMPERKEEKIDRICNNRDWEDMHKPPVSDSSEESDTEETPTRESKSLDKASRRSHSRSPSKSPRQKRSASPKAKYPGLCDMKRIKVNGPKPGKMYPSLTDIETTETETERETDADVVEDNYSEAESSENSLMSCSSLGTHIERMAKRNSPYRQQYKPTTIHHQEVNHPSETFDASMACHQIDELIDEALEGQDCAMDTLVEPKGCFDTSNKDLKRHLKATSFSSENALKKPYRCKPISLLNVPPHVIDSNLTVSPRLDDMGPESLVDSESLLQLSGNACVVSSPLIAAEMLSVEGSPFYSPLNNTIGSISQEPTPVSTSSPLYNVSVSPEKETSCSKNDEDHPRNLAQTPLLHTVSFYRKQQSSKKKNQPIPLTMQEDSAGEEAATFMEDDIEEEIRMLEEELPAQQKSIGQVSKALNLCKSTVEFSESSENVECERILLVATQKRIAILDEISRLKALRHGNRHDAFSPAKRELGPSCYGNMTIDGIQIKLQRTFLRSLSESETIYHFICLVKHKNQVEATSMISVGSDSISKDAMLKQGYLEFTNSFNLKHLYPDFVAQVELYMLTTRKEFLPHEAKYHIKKTPSKGGLLTLTPKRKDGTSKLTGRPFQNPAGPDAVRTPAFKLCGIVTIDISNLHRQEWTIRRSSITSPAEGEVNLKIDCSAEGGVEYCGFLTFFEEVGGLGAWHRRWCRLTPSHLNHWLYPEDEQSKTPIGSIRLRECVTTRVGTVSRDVCARSNTLLLVSTRPRIPSDEENMITSLHSSYTAVRHLLSADSREERDIWSRKFNKALANLRAWDPNARPPNDSAF